MTGEIKKCEYYDNGKCFNYDVGNPWCEDEDNCASYQLKRLEQENKELKEKVKDLDCMTGIFSARLANKYHSTLEEIREMLLEHSCADSHTTKYITNKINECIGG